MNKEEIKTLLKETVINYQNGHAVTADSVFTNNVFEKFSEAIAERLKKDEKGFWEPEIGERYFFVQSTGQVRNCCNTVENQKNICRIETGNFFETRIEAEEASYRTKYTNLFKKYVEAHSSVVDWDDKEQEVWSLNYNRNNGELLVQCSGGVGVQKQGAIYSTNKKAIEDAIEFVGKENVIEYIFGA